MSLSLCHLRRDLLLFNHSLDNSLSCDGDAEVWMGAFVEVAVRIHFFRCRLRLSSCLGCRLWCGLCHRIGPPQ